MVVKPEEPSRNNTQSRQSTTAKMETKVTDVKKKIDEKGEESAKIMQIRIHEDEEEKKQAENVVQ